MLNLGGATRKILTQIRKHGKPRPNEDPLRIFTTERADGTAVQADEYTYLSLIKAFTYSSEIAKAMQVNSLVGLLPVVTHCDSFCVTHRAAFSERRF